MDYGQSCNNYNLSDIGGGYRTYNLQNVKEQKKRKILLRIQLLLLPYERLLSRGKKGMIF